MPWGPLPRIAFAVAIHPFQPAASADLPLELGDELYIIEEGGLNSSWYRGYLVAPPSLLAGLTSVRGQTLEARVFSGIFPKTCVEVREFLGGIETTSELEERGTSAENPSRQGTRPEVDQYKGTLPVVGSRDHGYRVSTSEFPIPKPPNKLPTAVKLDEGIHPGSSASISSPTQFGISDLGFIEQEIQNSVSRPPAPVPMLKIGDETPMLSSEPLVDEIASCLREWHSTNLHELLLSRRYAELDKLSKLINQLDLSRRQLLHGVLTSQELRILRERIVWELVGGNKMLGNEVIVRDPEQCGRLLTAVDSPLEVARLQSVMSTLEQPPKPNVERLNLHHLMFELKDVTNYSKDIVIFLVSICKKSSDGSLKPLTETFTIELPAKEALSKVLVSLKPRTLFAELTPIETGAKLGSDSQLYLIIRARLNQIAMIAQSMQKAGTTKESPARGDSGNDSSLSSTVKGGRKSLMWAQSKMGGSQRHRNQSFKADEPKTLKDSLDEDRPTPSTNSDSSPSQQNPPMVKRDVGCAILSLKGMFEDNSDSEHTLVLWSASDSQQDSQECDEGFQELLQSINQSPDRRFSKSSLFDRIRIRLHSFLAADPDALIKSTPTLLHGISKTSRIGFAGAPAKPRSDIYVTIDQPVLSGHVLLSHPDKGAVPLGISSEMKNLQLTLEVRNSIGERIENCIFPFSNSYGQTAWRTTAIERGGSWFQTLRLAIPTDDVPGSHIIMSLADFPGFPFALCWIPLWHQNAFLQDRVHTPAFYIYDKGTSTVANGRGAYLDLPWDLATKDGSARELWSSHIAHLRIETFLCSTYFSQDQVLLGILRWKDQTDGQLLILLRQLVFVPQIELVKLVNNTFDALFAILVDRSGNDEYEDLIFSCLVTVLGLVYDRRFNLGPLVNEYADTRFNFPFATPCLIRSFLRLIKRPADYQNSRQLRAAFKVGRQLMRFIVVARTQQRAKEVGIGITNTGPAFTRELRRIFSALEEQMRDDSAALVGSKTLIVQHMHNWLPELLPCFSQEEILDMAINFVDSCENVQGKLVVHKLILIWNLLKSSKSLDILLKQKLNEKIMAWLSPYWGLTTDPSEQYREQIRLCCSILALYEGEYGPQVGHYYIKILQSYFTLRQSPRPNTNTLFFLFPSTYPFPWTQIHGFRDYDEVLTELASLKSTISVENLVEDKGQLGDPVKLIVTALEVNMSVLKGDAFPPTWLTMHVYHHRIIFGMLRSVTKIMIQDLLPPPDDAASFDTDLWKSLLVALLKLVRSDALALERLPEQKRRAVWKIAGDIREQGAELLGRIWDALGWETDAEEKQQYGLHRLGGYQVQYVPSLVGPIMELCLSIHEGLRGVAVEILQSMIISEWNLNEELIVVQMEMMHSLDNLFKSRNISENAQHRLFIGQLMEIFEPLSRSGENELWQATMSLVKTIDEMLDLLIAVYVPDQNESLRIMNTLRLMDFLRGVQKEDIYITYVHQLADVEAKARNPREAGLALKLHADLYSWDSSRILDELKKPSFPRQTSFERKETLYFDMIKYFEDGMAWECALACYRELAEQYEHAVFDFSKLARTQKSSARIYEFIAKGEVQNSRFFRVAYLGLGFTANLRGKTFVYEASASDRLASFMDRLQHEHPSAQIVTQGEHEESEGQFIHVTAIAAYRDLDHPLYQRYKVPLAVKEHLLTLNLNRFAVTIRRHSPKTGVKDQWVEKAIYTTEGSFPNILRRSEITQEILISLSPLQTAIERTVRKSLELANFKKKVEGGEHTAMSNLFDAVRSSLDPTSTTSVAQYREMLPAGPKSLASEQEQDASTKGLEKALQASLIDFALTLKQCLSLLSQKPFEIEQDSLSSLFTNAFAPELSAIAVTNTSTPPAIPPQLTAFENGRTAVLQHNPHNELRDMAAMIDHASLPHSPGVGTSPTHYSGLEMAREHEPSSAKSAFRPVINGAAVDVIVEDQPPIPSQMADGRSQSTIPKSNIRNTDGVAYLSIDEVHGAGNNDKNNGGTRPTTAHSGSPSSITMPVSKKRDSIRKRLSTIGIRQRPSRSGQNTRDHELLVEEK